MITGLIGFAIGFFAGIVLMCMMFVSKKGYSNE